MESSQNTSKKCEISAFLIDEVKGKPCLWMKTSPEYKNLTAKNQAWEAILAHLKTQFQQNNLQKFGLTSSKAVYSYWRNLRDTFTKKRKEAKGKSGSGLSDVEGAIKWPYYQAMMFLLQSEDYGSGIKATSSFVNLGQDAQNDDETELDSEAEESQENDDAQDFPEGLNQQPNVTEETESTSGSGNPDQVPPKQKRKRQTEDPLIDFAKTCQALTKCYESTASAPKSSFIKYGEFVGLRLSEMPQQNAMQCVAEIDKVILSQIESFTNCREIYSTQSSSENITVYHLN